MTHWISDTTHSEIGFTVKHLMINNVKGSFRSFKIDIESENDVFINPKINFNAEVATIDSGNPQRDEHLKSEEFFDANNFPLIEFEGTMNENEELTGNLTIRGTTKQVKLKSEFGGIAKDPWGNIKAGFTISGKISRKEWGLNWNAALETGGVLVSDEVKINAEIQLIKKN